MSGRKSERLATDLIQETESEKSEGEETGNSATYVPYNERLSGEKAILSEHITVYYPIKLNV